MDTSIDPWIFTSSSTPAAVPVALIPQLVLMLGAADREAQLQATLLLRKMASVVEPPIDAIVAAGIVPLVVPLLAVDDVPQLQLEAAWLLTNVTSGTQADMNLVVASGAVPYFVRLVGSPSAEVMEQACWALGNIAGDSPMCRDYVIAHGAVAPLTQCVVGAGEPEHLSLLRTSVWALSNLCRGSPPPDWTLVKDACWTFAQALLHSDDEVIADACWGIAYIAGGSNGGSAAVVNAGVLPHLARLAQGHSTVHSVPALQAAKAIASGPVDQKMMMILVGFLPVLPAAMQHSRRALSVAALETVSNLMSGGGCQVVQLVVNAELVPVIIQCLAGADIEVKKQAARCVEEFCKNAVPAQIGYAVERLALFDHVVTVLSVLHDVAIVKTALTILRLLLESSEQGSAWVNPDGIATLLRLEYDRDAGVSAAATAIISTYFPDHRKDEEEEEDEDECMAVDTAPPDSEMKRLALEDEPASWA